MTEPYSARRISAGYRAAEWLERNAPHHPRCFADRDQWIQWLAWAVIADDPAALQPITRGPKRNGKASLEFNSAIDFCCDCTLDHRAKMLAQDRCHPACLRRGGEST